MLFKLRGYKIIILLLSCFLIMGCATTYRFIRFYTNPEIQGLKNYFEFKEFSCNIEVRPDISKMVDPPDRLYSVSFELFSKYDCNDKFKKVFKTIKVEKAYFSYDKEILSLDLDEYRRSSRCKMTYIYQDIVIPDYVDTIKFYCLVSYFDDNQKVMTDTTITMYRYEEIWKGW